VSILDFLATYWDSILVIVLFAAAIVILAVKGKKNVIYKILYILVTEAEKQYGSGTGSLKLAAVIRWIWDRLPSILKIFITESTLERWDEDVLKQAKTDWENNSKIGEYINSQ